MRGENSQDPDSLTAALDRAWSRWPNRPALVSSGGCVTFDQLRVRVGALGAGLRRLGVGRGDRVVCSVSNRPELFYALGAAWSSRAIHVGADYQLTGPELSTIIRVTGAKVLLYEPPDDSPDPGAALRLLGRTHPDLRLVVVGDHPPPDGVLPLAELLGSPDGIRTSDRGPGGAAPEDPALIFVSSGTTGKPKATVGYQGNLGLRWQRLGGWLRFGPDDAHLAQLPLAHGFGLMMAVAGLLAGGRVALLRAFTPEEALRAIGRDGVTVVNGSPTHFRMVLERLDPGRHAVRSLRLAVGTAALFPPALVQSIWERLGVDFMFMYGASEGVGVATTDRDDILRGSVGRPSPGTVAILGPDHRPLPAGEIGEIAFSRGVYPVRYWTDPGPGSTDEASEEDRPDDRWYCSGDLGRLDEEGRLYILGRIKQQIDRGGLKVDPVEVEGALLRCAGVADAAVVGLPNPVLGEVICACVVPASDYPSLERLRSVLADQLAPYKLPDELCVLDQIPRTRLGKLDRPALQAEALALPRQSVRTRT